MDLNNVYVPKVSQQIKLDTRPEASEKWYVSNGLWDDAARYLGKDLNWNQICIGCYHDTEEEAEKLAEEYRVRQRVAKGLALLIEKYPDRIDRIDLGCLDMSSPCMCAIGQMFGSFRYELLGFDYPELNANLAACGFEFVTPPVDRDESPEEYSRLIDNQYEALRLEWIRQLTTYRAIASREDPV